MKLPRNARAFAPVEDCAAARLNAIVSRGQAESSSYLPPPLPEPVLEETVHRRFWAPHELAEMDGHG
jgi:hypothetical protein